MSAKSEHLKGLILAQEEKLEKIRSFLASHCIFCLEEKGPSELINKLLGGHLEPRINPPYNSHFKVGICEDCTSLVAEVFRARALMDTEGNPLPSNVVSFDKSTHSH